MNFLYNTAIGAYAFAARIASARSPKVRAMLDGQKRAVSHVAESREAKAPDGFDIWFHVASLGEFEQARPLIERIRTQQPAASILLTFFSPSGYEVRKNFPLVDCVAYLPFDKPALVNAFIDAAKPKRAVFVKYEFWGNYITSLYKRGIPVFLIDAIFRPEQAFFKAYGGTFRKILSCYTHIFVQDEDSRELLAGIGIENVTVAGDTRFDRVANVRDNAVSLPQIQDWLSGKPFTVVVGSSWQPDEDRYIPWINANPEARAIIAPHEFDAKRIEILRNRFSGKSVLWSSVKDSQEPILADTQVLIVDTFGLLSSLYRFGSVALIGGGFGVGIHNINEAAVYGIPVAFGPNHHKFKEARDLIECGGAVEYSDARGIAAVLDRWNNNPEALAADGSAAQKYINASLGATDRILPEIL